jgi:hypothetical protein
MEVNERAVFLCVQSGYSESFSLRVVGRKFQTDIRLTLLSNMLTVAGHEQQLERLVRRPSTASVNTARLETSFS